MNSNIIDGNTSDGYHTFNELYYHRMCLFAALVNQNIGISWKSKKHADNSMYDDYFIVGITTPTGNATYHYELKYWDLFNCKELDNAPEWDGHTPDDVCARILTIKSQSTRVEKLENVVQAISDYVFGNGLACMSNSVIEKIFEQNGLTSKFISVGKTEINTITKGDNDE